MFTNRTEIHKKYVEELLASCPEVLNVNDLARVAGWQPKRIYVLACRVNKGEQNLLPISIKTPGSNLLRFTRTAVLDWFLSAESPPPKEKKKSPGRPRGSISRRGIGRSSIEV